MDRKRVAAVLKKIIYDFSQLPIYGEYYSIVRLRVEFPEASLAYMNVLVITSPMMSNWVATSIFSLMISLRPLLI